MPIYEYACRACGAQREVMQKVSDAPLTTCPECQADAFQKKVSAAGFQLKGSGWYVTDFRGGSKKAAGGADCPAQGDSSSGACSGDACAGSAGAATAAAG
ncbi:FmdB family zinc ribbon protein [Immundisolibacter sp.]|uniref:FmdB family zinc ribbon protein n=1 Tax=Immundisolibacter sp. TaxID=1934948 RepID=UPI0026323A75|nr:FmdB family zinc ribbon protein [Immundisolibacter sp.]MDD3650797.1 zinc ribbon domain-containing protein [Immundisolibacter sp.]